LNHSKFIIDTESLGQHLANYRPWCRLHVRKLLYRQLGRRIDESDVIQSAWMEAFRKLDQFRGESEAEFFGWLKKILDNNLKNVIRDNMADKRDFRKEHELGAPMESASIQWFEPVAPGSSPSNRVIKGESALELASAMETLPENQRVAIELRHLQRLKLSEVCGEMGKTPDAVMSLIRRGMIKLSETLGASTG
jgi:RNA polymerase sigma-70 factor (ECF subfamily)